MLGPGLKHLLLGIQDPDLEFSGGQEKRRRLTSRSDLEAIDGYGVVSLIEEAGLRDARFAALADVRG